jgi:hypothetical protein
MMTERVTSKRDVAGSNPAGVASPRDQWTSEATISAGEPWSGEGRPGVLAERAAGQRQCRHRPD